MSETAAITQGGAPAGPAPGLPSPRREAWRRFRRNTPAVGALVFLSLLLVLVALWPWIAPYPYQETSAAQFQPPSARHWFGTDVHGRDLLTRLFHGARI